MLISLGSTTTNSTCNYPQVLKGLQFKGEVPENLREAWGVRGRSIFGLTFSTPSPAIVTIRDKKDYVRILLYS